MDHSLFYMFNFSQTPLKPLILPSNVLATYPLSSCSLCKIGFGLQPTVVQNPPAYPQGTPWLGPPDDEGDPYD